MAATRQLGKEDILFIAGESDVVYHHTAGLVILDTSACPRFSFEYLKEKVIERIQEVPHFRWKLHEVPMGLDLPYWVEDENFRYENHFKRIAVPAPGDREALSEVVAYLYRRHLDRNKPLWEFWLIEGLAGGKYAILQKLHHCMMDGQGASKLGELLCDFEPDAEPRPLDSAIKDAKAGAVPDWLSQSATAALHLARLPGNAYREAIDFISPKIMERLGLREKSGRPRVETPVASFNGEVGADRGFVFGSLSLVDIKTVKNAFDASVNDVVLALVSSTLRRYLLEHDALPELSLRTGMPVSLRSEDDDEISNRVTQTPVTLATDIDDPVERLLTISEDCEEAKQLARSGGRGLVEMIQNMPPMMVSALVSTTSPEQAAAMLGINLIVSSVRGSDQPMYIAGARMETMYPMSIITPGMGINFTCVSYAGQVDVGITIEPELVPEAWEIQDGLDDALQEYVQLAVKKKRRRKVPVKAGKRGAKPKAKAKSKAKSKAKARPKPKPKAKTTGARKPAASQRRSKTQSSTSGRT